MKKNFYNKITNVTIIFLVLTLPILFLNQNNRQNPFQSLNFPRTIENFPMKFKQQEELILFNGLNYTWQLDVAFPAPSSYSITELYSYEGGNMFNVTENNAIFGGTNYRDVNNLTRLISNSYHSGGFMEFFLTGSHEQFCIFNNVSINDTIVIGTINMFTGDSDRVFQVVGEKYISKLGYILDCWELTDPQGSIAYYEKSTGLLITANILGSYDHKMNVTYVNVVFPSNNFTPQLTDGKVEPVEGDSITVFNFTVNYTDPDNNRPDYMRITINDTAYEMTPLNSTDKNYVDGAIYNLTTPLPAGNCTFYFNASDGKYQVGIPTSGRYIGPNVTYINYNIPQLSSGSVTPSDSYSNLKFTFQVTYTDADNNPPIYMNITLNNTDTYAMEQQDPYDLNYIDGCIFQFETNLTPGSYKFHFNASDDGILDVGYPISDIIGPNVSYPPFEIFDGMTYTWTGTYFGNNWNGQEQISYKSGVTFLVEEVINYFGIPFNNRRDVNMETRLISNSKDTSFRLGDGTHDPYFIFNTTKLNDVIPIAVYDIYTDVDYTVVGETYLNRIGKTFECWELRDSQGRIAYYEKKTGILISGTFYNGFVTYQINIASSNAHFPSNNFAPQLFDAKVDPLIGDSTTYFNFTVNYNDADNNHPQYVRLTVNETVFDMQRLNPTDTNYVDGAIYSFITPLLYGNYTFYLNTSDEEHDVGYPQSGIIVGPNVTYKNNNTPQLSSGSVTPIEDYSINAFLFQVNYTDADNNQPIYINVTLNNTITFAMEQQDPSDFNYMDGCIFQYVAYLNGGNYTFHFNTSDDGIIDVGYPSNDILGPNVSYPPFEIFDGLYYFWEGKYGSFDWNGQENYTQQDGVTFHVDEIIDYGGPVSNQRDINMETRLISNSVGGSGNRFQTGTHEPFFIFNTSKLNDEIPISVNGGSDVIYTVIGEEYLQKLGTSIDCWKLIDSKGRAAYYDKKTGILINGTFYNGLAVTKISVTSTNVQFPPNNFTPILLDGKVEPISGDLTTIFNFTVNYSDADNNRPDYIRLTLNETSYDMQPSDPTDKNYVDGVIYNFIAPLPVGNYSFYFNASDSLHPIGYPQVGKIIGPNVTYKNDNIPLLSDGEVTPIENYESVYFIFKVNYTDLDNNEPIYINVTISGVGTFPMSKQDPLDLNYMDGCIFNYSTLLDVGKYTYYFNTSDDGIIDVGFPPNNPLIGPNVTISPLGIFDGMFIEWSGIYSTSYSWNGREVYSYVSGSNFHVSESLTGIYNTITDRNIDIETRTVSSAGSETFYFWANNYHEIFCIPKSTRMFDIVPIATPWKSEYDFNVTGEKIINILGLNLTCWELSGPQNSTIYYEKYSGLLINATLYETPSDLFTLVITNTSTEFQENKNIPQLLDGKVEPIEGNLTTFFNFTVNYTDVDNNRPDYIRAIINETVYEMTPLDPWDKNYIDGVLYHLNILLPLGNYTFYFNTSDGWNHVRFPDPGELIGPNVTYLNENNPILSNGVVTPIKGFDDTLFTFEVNYTDLDNNEPVYTNITIEGVGTFSMMKQDPYDLNFIDGCIFWFNTTLDSEIYSYYFNCSDGVFPASDGPYTGLVVARTLLKNYTMIVDYPYEWINATTGVRCNMAGQDDAAQMFYLPFRFKFYNETFDQIYVCTNGFVSFTYQTPHYNVPFPIGTYPYMIAPFWEDLRAANPCNIFVRNLTSPNRVVIEWKDYYTYPGSLVGTFEIILYESGDIIFNYDYLDYTSDYTCGLNFGPDTKYFNMFTGLNSSIDNFSILFYQKPNIYYPELKSGSVIPGTGYQATEFNFSVIYTDLDNDAPLFVNVLINGTPYQMEMQNLTDNNYTDGCIYQYLTYLSPGMYNYSFECNDGSLVNSTIIYTGLNVTEANYYAPILTNGIVNPPTGDASTLFVFRINYTDIDNNTPEYVNITINSTTYAMVKQNSMDTNYMDGCIFIFNTILSVGTYVYYFNCSDGVFTTVDGPYIGPLVEEPSLKNYTMVVDYTYEWIDATTGVRCSLNEVDDGAQMFNLPFNFTFYNETFDRIYVCTNGFVSFTYQTTWFNVPFPTASNPYMIAPFWDDLRAADPCNIFVKNLTSPNRVVIEWQNYRTLLGSLVGTFEIILFESGDIIFNYDYLDYASSYTCGLNYGPDTRYFNSFTGLNTSIDDFSILFTYQNVTEEIPSGHPSSPPLFLPPREDQSLIFIIIIIIGAVAAAVGTLLYLRFWKKPEKRAFIKRPKKALAEKKAITTNGTRSIEKKVKESKIQESTEISESVVEEEKPVTKKLPEMEIKEVEPIPDEEIQFIQNLEKEELIEYVSNFEKDLLDLLPPEHPILSESKQWITDITNYPLSNLTQNDARKLIMDMKKWEKEIFKSNKTGN